MSRYTNDGSGNIVSQTLEILSPPQIIGQPVRQVTEPGDIATFSVTVADASVMTYQWKFNGIDIPEATSDSLILPNVSKADEGRYSVLVANSMGGVTSANAELMLDADHDGLPDTWESFHFGPLSSQQSERPPSQRSEGDPDRDGVSNLNEFLDGTDPNSNTSLRPRLIAYSDAGGFVTVLPMKLSYSLGEEVTLAATPFAPSAFVGWQGDLDGLSSPVSITMTANKRIRARFSAELALAPGLVALWRGESDASDLIGGHHGTFFTGTSTTLPSVTRVGKVGGAFNFDGTVHVRVPDSPALRPPQITVEAWVFPTLQSNTFQTIIARGSSTTDGDTWSLGLLNGVPHFVTQPLQDLAAPSAIPLNDWTHLAISFDGTTKRLYVNGVVVAFIGALVPPPALFVGWLAALSYDAAAIPVTIGSDWAFNASSSLFVGRVDEVAIYNRALSGNEIVDIFSADFVGRNFTSPYFTSPSQLPDAALGKGYGQQITTVLGVPPVSFTLTTGALPIGMTLSTTGVIAGAPTAVGSSAFTVRATDAVGQFSDQLCNLQVFQSLLAPTGLVGWWRAEGNARDSIGSNHGTVQGGAGFAGGRVGQAFVLDGTSGFVQVPDAPAIRVLSLTFEAWVNFDTVNEIRVIFAKPVGAGESDSYSLWLDAASGTLIGGVGDESGFGPFLSAFFSPVPGQWYHLAYTFDDGLDQQALYIDGVQVADGSVPRSIGYDAQPLLLGRDTQDGVPSFFFQGRIDEASVYDRPLTAVEIAAIYNAGSQGKRGILKAVSKFF